MSYMKDLKDLFTSQVLKEGKEEHKKAKATINK